MHRNLAAPGSGEELHPDLLAARKLVYDPCGFDHTAPQKETESRGYGAYSFELNGSAVRFRVAKITPTKIGQFVVLWKRVGNGPIQPYDMSDHVDFMIISTRKGDDFGQFVIQKSVLCAQDIVSSNGRGGKRAIRVYPPWDNVTSRHAENTQRWQSDCCLPIPQVTLPDFDRARQLFRQ